LGDKVGFMNSLLDDKAGDIGGNNVHSWAGEVQWGGLGTALVYDILTTRQAKVLTGQKCSGHAMWCIVFLCCPFF
jgi:hypothetical protein